MPKAKSSRPRPAAKRKTPPKTVAEYLARVPRPARATLQRLRTAIRSALPREATETISYGIPAFRLKKALVWYAAFTDHCSLFPTAAVIAVFKTDLRPYKTSKGTIHFPLGKPLPIALIQKLVKARFAQWNPSTGR